MSVYRGSEPHDHIGMGEEFVQHWKYVKKIKQGKSYRYFYTMDEWKAFNSGESSKKQTLGSKISTNKVAGLFNKSKNNPINDIKDRARKGKDWFDKKLHRKDDKEKKQQKPKEKKKLKTVPGIDTNPGVDEKGHKYIAKTEINGKTRYFYTEDELKAYQDRLKYMANEPEFMKKYAHSKEPYTAQEDAFNVNPYYNFPFDDATMRTRFKVNCAECTAIYELRRRGYDVESNGFTGIVDKEFIDYNTDKRYGIMYENPKIQECKRTFRAESTYKELKSQIDKNPPGSRGDISVQWKGGGGHSMVWEKDLKGNIKIIDTQCTGNGYYTTYDLKTLSKACNNAGGTARVVRTDNLKLKPGITAIFMDANQEYRQYRKPKGDYHIDKNGREHLSNLSKKERETKYPYVGASKRKTTKQKGTNQKANRIKALAASGKTYLEISNIMGVSTSTISKYLK